MPWTKGELWATVKDFSKVTENPHRLAEEFNTVIQTQQPGLSDLRQLVHTLVGEGQAQHGMRTATWENPKRPLELQPGDHPANSYDQPQAIARRLHGASPAAFPKPGDWNKMQACTQ